MVREISKGEALLFINSFFPQYKITDDPFEKYLGYFDNGLLGVVIYSVIYERAEINFICVKKEYRNKKIGSVLMQNTVEKTKLANCKNISLEVRKDNISAINLYKKFGFVEVSKEKNTIMVWMVY